MRVLLLVGFFFAGAVCGGLLGEGGHGIHHGSRLHPAFKGAGTKPGLHIWRIQSFEPVPVPVSEYGKFYTGDSYIVLHVQANKNTKEGYTWNIHYWLGEKTTEDESAAAAILAVNLDDGLGGHPVQHREQQGHESQLFLSYFKPNIRYMTGGTPGGLRPAQTNQPTEKRLYQVKGNKNIRVRMVELNVKSMNNGDCFVLDCGHEIYVYVGSKAKGTERLKAVSAANTIKSQDHAGRGHVTVIDNTSTDDEVQKFFKELGSGSSSQVADAPTGGDDTDFEKTQESTVELYKVSDAGGQLKSDKIGHKPLSRTSLVTGDCYILDTGSSGIYVWVGKGSTTQEKVEALKMGQAFIAAKNYPSWTKMRRIIEGGEPSAFKEYFAEWRDTNTIAGLGRG
uniref:Venom gelsolin n=1 Tax=Lethocerus distinctifemur TaxID=280095 RepID=A0A2K8JW66_9HEMI|nr:venom gelsolin [Lethocerus distinctifemur]